MYCNLIWKSHGFVPCVATAGYTVTYKLKQLVWKPSTILLVCARSSQKLTPAFRELMLQCFWMLQWRNSLCDTSLHHAWLAQLVTSRGSRWYLPPQAVISLVSSTGEQRATICPSSPATCLKVQFELTGCLWFYPNLPDETPLHNIRAFLVMRSQRSLEA